MKLYPFNAIDNVYAKLADSAKFNADGKKLFIVNKTFATGLITQHLHEEDRQIMNCDTCRNFLMRVANNVYFDDAGVKRSVLFHIRDSFAEYFTKDQLDFFRALNEEIVAVDIRDSVVDAYSTSKHLAMSGNFPHYHCDFVATVAKRSLKENMVALTNLAKAYKGLPRLETKINELLLAAAHDKRLVDDHREKLTTVSALLHEINEGKTPLHKANELVARFMHAGKLDHIKLLHFSGSVLGSLIDTYISRGAEKAIAKYEKETSIANYKNKTSEIKEHELKNSQELISTKYRSAVQERIAVEEDIAFIWKAQVKEEAEETDVVDSWFAQQEKKPDAVQPHYPVKTITVEDFIEMLPNIANISFNKGNYPTAGVVLNPVAETSPPIYRWTEVDPARRYVTIHPLRYYHLGAPDLGNEISLIGIAEKPWVVNGVNTCPTIPSGYMLVFGFNTSGAAQFQLETRGQAYVNELQPHRKVMDKLMLSVIPKTDVSVGMGWQSLAPTSPGRELKVDMKDGTHVMLNVLYLD